MWPAEVAPAESSPMFHHPGAPGVGSHCQLPKVESHRAPQPGRAAAARALPDDLAWGSLFNLIGPSWCPAAAPSGRVCLCASPTSSPPCTAHKGSGMSRGWHRAPGQRLGQGCGGTSEEMEAHLNLNLAFLRSPSHCVCWAFSIEGAQGLLVELVLLGVSQEQVEVVPPGLSDDFIWCC